MNATDGSDDWLEVRVEVTRMRRTADGPRRARGTKQVTAVLIVPVRAMRAARTNEPLAVALQEASYNVLRLADPRQAGMDVDPFWLDDGRAARVS